MTDIIGDAPHVEPGFTPREERSSFWREPMPLALLTAALAVLSLVNAPLLSGRSYAVYFLDMGTFNGDEGTPSTAPLEWGAWLSVGIALLVALLASYGRRRLIDDDPRWVSGLLEAALGLALVSTALHAVLATIVQVKGNGLYSLLGGLTG